MGATAAFLAGVAVAAVGGGCIGHMVGRIQGRDLAQRDDDRVFVEVMAALDLERNNPRVPGPMSGVIRGRS